MAIITVSGNVGFSKLDYLNSGTAILTVSIADKRYNKQTEEEETYWVRAVWFGERAEKLSNSLLKAKIVSVMGRENYKIYEGKIDRSIDPIHHEILQFQPREHQENHNTPSNDYPPITDNDIPFL